MVACHVRLQHYQHLAFLHPLALSDQNPLHLAAADGLHRLAVAADHHLGIDWHTGIKWCQHGPAQKTHYTDQNDQPAQPHIVAVIHR